MKVAIFGGTGFVGTYLIDALLSAGHQPLVLTRPGSEGKLEQPERCRLTPGYIEDREAVAATLDGADAAIYNIGILREDPARGISFSGLQLEGAKRAMDAAVAAGARRFLLMSANGVRADGTTYQRTKLEAEHGVLERDIAAVDLRLLDRITVRLRATADANPSDTVAPADVPTASTGATPNGKT